MPIETALSPSVSFRADSFRPVDETYYCSSLAWRMHASEDSQSLAK
jgi:hypothetical protein